MAVYGRDVEVGFVTCYKCNAVGVCRIYVRVACYAAGRVYVVSEGIKLREGGPIYSSCVGEGEPPVLWAISHIYCREEFEVIFVTLRLIRDPISGALGILPSKTCHYAPLFVYLVAQRPVERADCLSIFEDVALVGVYDICSANAVSSYGVVVCPGCLNLCAGL